MGILHVLTVVGPGSVCFDDELLHDEHPYWPTARQSFSHSTSKVHAFSGVIEAHSDHVVKIPSLRT